MSLRSPPPVGDSRNGRAALSQSCPNLPSGCGASVTSRMLGSGARRESSRRRVPRAPTCARTPAQPRAFRARHRPRRRPRWQRRATPGDRFCSGARRRRRRAGAPTPGWRRPRRPRASPPASANASGPSTPPAAADSASTTHTTLSSRTRASFPNVLSSARTVSVGSTRPLVSMSRYSIGPAALGSATPAFPATSSIFHTCVSSSPPRVQHRHPFVSSTTSPSAPPVEPPGVSRATKLGVDVELGEIVHRARHLQILPIRQHVAHDRGLAAAEPPGNQRGGQPPAFGRRERGPELVVAEQVHRSRLLVLHRGGRRFVGTRHGGRARFRDRATRRSRHARERAGRSRRSTDRRRRRTRQHAIPGRPRSPRAVACGEEVKRVAFSLWCPDCVARASARMTRLSRVSRG